MMTVPSSHTRTVHTLWPFTALRSATDLWMGTSRLGEKRLGIPVTPEFPEEALFTPAGAKLALAGQSADMLIAADVLRILQYPWQIAQWNSWLLRHELSATAKDFDSVAILPPGVQHIGQGDLLMDPDAVVEPCICVTREGPIWIDKGAHIMAGATLRGPLYIGKNAVVKMGATIYGGTSIGPACTVGGEIKNSVLMGYSNKAHDGYLGDSVLGYWCNLGAGTTNSNLKNTAGAVRIFHPASNARVDAGPKAGVFFGDFSRTAIQTAFSTGTIIGVCCHIPGPKPETFVPDFSWGGSARYRWDKVESDLRAWMGFKGQELAPELLERLYQLYHQPII